MTAAGTARRILAAAAFALLCVTGGGLAPSAAAQELSALARLDATESAIADTGSGIGFALSLSQPVAYRVTMRNDPPRLVIDFREVDFSSADPAAVNRSGHVRDLRWGRFRPGWSRLVAELDGPFRVAEASQDTVPARILVRLEPTDAAGLVAAVAERDDPPGVNWDVPPAPDLPAPDLPAADLPDPKRRQTGAASLVIVLDPGHGGIDPGAEAGTMKEADLVLTFARELTEALLRSGAHVLLTRNEDVFVPLETRISVARAAGADLFLSLHADALAEGTAVGATVYTLADDASDAASERLAERHDRADLLAGVDLQGHDDEVAGVLMDLARQETQPRSERFAATLAAEIRAAGLKTHRHPVQSADFSVLKSADIPSVLLELGFLSSEADRVRLADPVWRSGMQGAIQKAIADWAAADAAEARLIRQ